MVILIIGISNKRWFTEGNLDSPQQFGWMVLKDSGPKDSGRGETLSETA